MPTYEYKCDSCGNRFEKFQSITASALKKCPSCGKNKARRLIGTGAGILFKGSGFYITDYRDSAYKEKAKADTPGGRGETKSPEAKPGATESKPVPESKPSPTPKADAKPSKKHKK